MLCRGHTETQVPQPMHLSFTVYCAAFFPTTLEKPALSRMQAARRGGRFALCFMALMSAAKARAFSSLRFCAAAAESGGFMSPWGISQMQVYWWDMPAQ